MPVDTKAVTITVTMNLNEAAWVLSALQLQAFRLGADGVAEVAQRIQDAGRAAFKEAQSK